MGHGIRGAPVIVSQHREGQKFELIAPVEDAGLSKAVTEGGAGFGNLFNNGKKSMLSLN